MKLIEELLKGATELGACNKTKGITTLAELVALFTSPQGREFCIKHNYPSREQWRQIADHWSAEELSRYGVYVDLPSDYTETQDNPGTIIAVGETTHIDIRIWGADKLYRIMLMHGATATITASHYAVFDIEAGNGCKYQITKDETARQL